MLYTKSIECYFGQTILHACFSFLLFMYKGKISRRIFKVVFLKMPFFPDTSVCDVADEFCHLLINFSKILEFLNISSCLFVNLFIETQHHPLDGASKTPPPQKKENN